MLMFSGDFFKRTSLLAIVLVGLIPLSDAFAQGRVNLKNVDQRLQRVERVLDQSLLDLLQQVESLKREIRILRGELESQSNDVRTLKKRNRDLYLDTDQRLTSLEGRLEGLLPGPDGELLDGSPSVDDAIPEQETGNGTDQQPAAGAAIGATSEEIGSSPVFVNTELAGNSAGAVSQSARPATAEEKQSYTNAYDMLASGKHGETVQAFRRFLERYPDGPYSDNAWYWQGEALYAQRQFDLAIQNFQTVIDSFPQSPKLPDARLKVGYSLYEQKRYDEARAALTAVKTDYPGRSAAVLAQKRLIQMDKQGQ